MSATPGTPVSEIRHHSARLSESIIPADQGSMHYERTPRFRRLKLRWLRHLVSLHCNRKTEGCGQVMKRECWAVPGGGGFAPAPPAPACSVSPSGVTPSPDGTITASLTITTTAPKRAQATQIRGLGVFNFGWVAVLGMTATVCCFGLKPKRRRLPGSIVFGLLLGSLVLQTACSSGSNGGQNGGQRGGHLRAIAQ